MLRFETSAKRRDDQPRSHGGTEEEQDRTLLSVTLSRELAGELRYDDIICGPRQMTSSCQLAGRPSACLEPVAGRSSPHVS